MNRRTLAVLCVAALAVTPILAFGGTVILSTTTPPASTPNDYSATALPSVGYWAYDVVVKSSGTGALATANLYLQSQGISGDGYYTVYNSTITACSAFPCTRLILPDVYTGGYMRAWWTITGSSATITVTARKVTP